MRWLWRGLAVFVLFVVLAGTLWMRASLPRTSGVARIAGLAAPIEIVRDRHDIPHIHAQSEADAYFGLGFVHAQERLWQMELNRRIGAGTLAEVAGKAALAHDRAVAIPCSAKCAISSAISTKTRRRSCASWPSSLV